MELMSVAFFVGALSLNAGTPGPSIAALVSRVLTNGWRDVFPFILAMWIGEIIWLTMALAGLTALAQTFQFGFEILKWLGVAYLAWLAVKMWRQPLGIAEGELPRRTSPISMFATGMALTLGNPKIMVFYLALLPALIDLSSVGLAQWAILTGVTFLTLAAIDLTWTFPPLGSNRHQGRSLPLCPAKLRSFTSP